MLFTPIINRYFRPVLFGEFLIGVICTITKFGTDFISMSNKPSFGRSRVLLSNLKPQVDNGRFAVKRVEGEKLKVEVCLVADGHDVVAGALAFRQMGQKWQFVNLAHLGNDLYSAEISLPKKGNYEYKIQGWLDYALTWLHGLEKKYEDGQNVAVHMTDGKSHIQHLAKAGHEKATILLDRMMEDAHASADLALEGWLEEAFRAHPEKTFLSESEAFPLRVDRKKALYSSWYEFFPRSAAEEGHASFKDVEKLLPRVADLGFDVLYFPPIHPIGEVNRKGKNNATEADADDAGSPWAIGSALGGHKSVHPELGTLEDYKILIKKANDLGLEIALDLAYQAAPDHPWVKEQPGWFKWRSDGTVQYAENPPKKYQDILPIYFESEDWEALWDELLAVILFWVEAGVKIFRVDNPHTKAINFWEWAIAETHKKDPDIIFLAEAFTKPALMKQLAKAGFTQGYTYYTWRNFRHELIEYMNELSQGDASEYFRPNFWPNTPDILPYSLQSGNESLYLIRLFMAATLSSNYGVYGPVYEHLVHQAMPGKEEYFNSEKYEVQHWNWEVENKITWLMRLVNTVRKNNPALQQTRNYLTLNIENQSLYAYYKWEGDSKMIMVVNLDPYSTQEGWVQLPLQRLGNTGSSYHFHDHATGADYQWSEEWNYVRLDPALPFHLLELRS